MSHRALRLSAVFGALILMSLTTSGCSSPEPDPEAASREPATSLEALLSGRLDADVAVVYRNLSGTGHVEWAADEVMHAASTMKVPVMIEVYRQAGAGSFAMDDPLLIKAEFKSLVDGSPYSLTAADDSDKEIYDHLGGSLPIRELVRRMIVVSSNLATNLLIDLVGAANVQSTIEGLGTRGTKVLRGVQDIKAYEAGLSNVTTAHDLAVLMQALAEGRAVSPEASAEMMEVLAAQEFNQMIPAGLPAEFRVAHKTGSITRIRHDAAVVTAPEGQRYVLVVMTRGFDDGKEAGALIAQVSELIHEIWKVSK